MRCARWHRHRAWTSVPARPFLRLHPASIPMTELTRLTACAAVDLLERRQVSPLELVDAAAARIAATDGAINALPTLCLDRARDQAKRLMDAPRATTSASGDGRGRLHGLPIAVKDNIDVAGVRCTSGSMAFEHRIAPAA